MKVSAVSVTLSARDIFSIIEDFVEVEGLKIDSIDIGELITIKGVYSKGLRIPFDLKAGFGNVVDNAVIVKVINMNVMKLNILSGIKNIALKKFLKDFSEYGIVADGDNIKIDLVMISKLVPYIYFKLERLRIVNKCVVADFEELIYAKNKETIKIEKKFQADGNIKISDKYAEKRSKIAEKFPDKYQKLFEYALMVPDIISLMYRLFRDKRVGLDIKLKVGAILLYLASPIDVIPDFIPMIGRVDDVAIAFFGLNAIINDIPEEIIIQNWQGKENIILTVKEAVNYISQAVGSENVAKLINSIKDIFKKARSRKKKQDKEQDLNG